jgi:hypothetical protein
MTRVSGVDPKGMRGYIDEVFKAQERSYGAPLFNHLLYARRPTIFRGARAMWTGIDSSGLIHPKLKALLNRRVAALNNCEF